MLTKQEIQEIARNAQEIWEELTKKKRDLLFDKLNRIFILTEIAESSAPEERPNTRLETDAADGAAQPC